MIFFGQNTFYVKHILSKIFKREVFDKKSEQFRLKRQISGKISGSVSSNPVFSKQIY